MWVRWYNLNMNGLNFPPGGSQGPAPFPGGIPQGGQPIPPQPGTGGGMPSPLPPVGGPSVPTPPPQPVGPTVPPPPPAEIGVRTMASDLQSMQSSGGAGPAPKTFKPEDFSSEPVFKPSSMGVKSGASASAVKVVPPNHARKSLLITLGILVFLALIGAVIYFYVLPIFTAKTTPTPAPVVQAPTPTPTPVPAPVPTGLTQHQTFFTAPASPSASVSLDLSLVSVQAAIAAVSSDTQPVGTFKEINFAVGGKPWTAQDFLGFVLPSLTKDFVSNTFEQDFTSYVYYDKNGAWPGYVFKLKSGVDATAAKATADPVIEASPAVFFQTSPGAQSKTAFSDGALPDGKAVRFVTFSKKGAALEYSWFGSYLTVSTSYQGLIEAVKHLGV